MTSPPAPVQGRWPPETAATTSPSGRPRRREEEVTVIEDRQIQALIDDERAGVLSEHAALRQAVHPARMIGVVQQHRVHDGRRSASMMPSAPSSIACSSSGSRPWSSLFANRHKTLLRAWRRDLADDELAEDHFNSTAAICHGRRVRRKAPFSNDARGSSTGSSSGLTTNASRRHRRTQNHFPLSEDAVLSRRTTIPSLPR